MFCKSINILKNLRKIVNKKYSYSTYSKSNNADNSFWDHSSIATGVSAFVTSFTIISFASNLYSLSDCQNQAKLKVERLRIMLNKKNTGIEDELLEQQIQEAENDLFYGEKDFIQQFILYCSIFPRTMKKDIIEITSFSLLPAITCALLARKTFSPLLLTKQLSKNSLSSLAMKKAGIMTFSGTTAGVIATLTYVEFQSLKEAQLAKTKPFPETTLVREIGGVLMFFGLFFIPATIFSLPAMIISFPPALFTSRMILHRFISRNPILKNML